MNKQTDFGKYLADNDISYEDAAIALDITRSYVGMLVRGDHSPALTLAFKIADWAHGKVPVESWERHLG